MKGRMRKITGILLAFVLCIGTASQSGAVTIDEAEKKADQLESDKKKAEEEKKTLSEKLDEIIKKMNETQEHLTAKEDEISDAENELIQAQIAEDDQYDSMKKRIRYLYAVCSVCSQEKLCIIKAVKIIDRHACAELYSLYLLEVDIKHLL